MEETTRLAENLFLTKMHCGRIAKAVRPGQFVMVSFPGAVDPLLPRAFSVCDVFGETISLFYAAIGRGTRQLSKLRPGDLLIVNGPLGNGFPSVLSDKKVWLVVGGSGVAVVPIVTKELKRSASKHWVFYGAKSLREMVHFDSVPVLEATDDGSAGYHGTVIDLVKNELKGGAPDMIFACGPTKMLIAAQREFSSLVPTYLSVEAPMACGTGLCQGCPVKKRGTEEYYLACKDGPVFLSGEIDLEQE